MQEKQKILVLKILIAGEGNSGKTSLIRRYCEGEFDPYRAHTIGLEFHSKILHLSAGTIKLALWDLAGQPQFRTIRKEFYKGSRATALVFDLTSRESLLELPTWYNEIQQAVPGQKYLLVGNKNDLKRKIDPALPERFARAIQAPYLETSAKNDYQVEKMFKHLAALAITKQPIPPNV